jgi:hypothetical protein
MEAKKEIKSLEAGEIYTITGYGKSYNLEFQRMRYDQYEFRTKEEVSYYWCNTMGGKRGGGFSGHWYLILPLSDFQMVYHTINCKDALTIHDWTVDQLLKTPNDKIGNSNMAITIKIAESMMKKNKLAENAIKFMINKIKDAAIEIIDMKQFSWEQLCAFQANQLPF